MSQKKIRAVYMRGGTSRCLVFHQADLPPAGAERDRTLLAALGSPDPYGRQLDGMGGGISSLSKACIIGAATHPDADVDYTFAQIEVAKATVDYKGNCGNCSSSVGPFAIDEGLVKPVEGETLVRIHNTNTRKLIIAHVPVRDGEAAVEGDFELAGVAGRGARIALDFLDPGGAGTETPQEIDSDRALSDRLEAIRVEAATRMGIPGSAAVPKIAMVAPPTAFTALDGVRHAADTVDLITRVISMGNCHRAVALTVAMCLGVAARLDGTVVRECVGDASHDIRLGHPSGMLPIDAAVRLRAGAAWAERVTVYRTARRLMEGFARIP